MSEKVTQLIEDVNKKYGNTTIIVTHNDAIKDMADRVIYLHDGRIRENIKNTHKIGDEMTLKINRDGEEKTITLELTEQP